MTLVFERYAPEWPSAPAGVLAGLWKQEARPSAEKLIDLARTLYDPGRGITSASVPAFRRKIRQLLPCQDPNQYEELLAELTVGALLAIRAGPVPLEPLARSPGNRGATQPESPDFAIRLPESDILIEVTTIQIGALNNWQRAMEVIREKIKEAAVNAGLAKEVEIHVPLGVRADALTRNLIDRVIVAMKAAQTGNMHVELGPATASVIWRDIPVFSSPSDLLQYGLPTENFSAVIFQNSAVITAASSKVVPILGPNVEELFVKSIRNTIDGKREQFTINAPSLLILQPGAWRIPLDYVRHLIDKRIWPNRQYAWLTAIGLLEPRRTYNLGDPPTRLTVSWNTQPRAPRTDALHALIEDNAWFSDGLRLESPK